MATNSEDPISKPNITQSRPPTVLAEYYPTLSIMHIYLTSNDVSPETSLTVAEDGRSLISTYPQLQISFENISIEKNDICCDLLPHPPSEPSSRTLHARLVVTSTQNTVGSSAVELFKNPLKSEEDMLKRLFSWSQNPISISEVDSYAIHCFNCKFRLGDNVHFQKVRQLPGYYWEHRANEMWFCHLPHPAESTSCHPPPAGDSSSADKHATGEMLDKSLLKLSLNSSCCKENVFQLTLDPDPNLLLYGTYYWIMNSKHLKIHREQDTASCGQCGEEIGSFLSPSSVQVWTYAVSWLEAGLHAIRPDTPLSSFQRIICAVIRESEYYRPKILLKSYDGKASVFLWTWNADASVFMRSGDRTIKTPGGIDTEEYEGSMKFMMATVADTIDLDVDVSLTIPSKVFEAGLAALIRLPVSVTYPCRNSQEKIMLTSAYLILYR